MKTMSKVEMKATFKSEQHAIEQIKELSNNIVKNVEKIGIIVSEGRIKYGDKFVDKLPNILSKSFYRNCEAVADGILDSRLAVLSGLQYYRLKRYPKRIQTDILDKGVKVLSNDGSHLLVNIANLTKDQIDQVFDYDSVRDIPAQRAFIESRLTRNIANEKIKTDKPDFIVLDGVLIVNKQGIKLTKSDLLEILSEMVK